MFLLSVIPISRGIGKEELTYFSTQQVSVGSLVSIPLRSRTVSGLVVRSESAVREKARLRSEPYMIKRLEHVKTRAFLSEPFFKTVEHLTAYYATTTGALLSALLPSVIVSSPPEISSHTSTARPRTFSESLSLNIDDAYTRARRNPGSIYILVPTLSRGAELHQAITGSILLHGGLPIRTMRTLWKKAVERKSPVVVIGTGPFLALPRADWTAIIVDSEFSHSYKTQARPFVDFRTAARAFAFILRIPIIYSDPLPRTETRYRVSAPRMKTQSLAPLIVRDMRTTSGDIRPHSLFSPELDTILTEPGTVFLFTARRGLAPLLVCRDCGSTILCRSCAAPVALHTRDTTRLFICHHCGKKHPSADQCPMCKGWRIEFFGIGTERVEKEIKKRLPGRAVFRIDSDGVPHARALDEKLALWQDTNGVCVGTEMALGRAWNAAHCAVVSVDALCALPDFRITERIYHLLYDLRTRTRQPVLVQTRNPESVALSLCDDSEAFYSQELEERNRLSYPPFTTLIKVSTSGPEKALRVAKEHLSTHFAGYDHESFEAFTSRARGKKVLHTIIRTQPSEWPNPNLVRLLRTLPPQFAVDVDPLSLL